MSLRGDDELRHLPGLDVEWGESWYHDFASSDGDYGGWLRLGLYPNLGVAWYWLAIVRRGHRLVLLADTTAPAPERGAPLAIRTPTWETAWECTERFQAWRITGSGRARTYANPADAMVRGHGGSGDVDVRYELEWRAASVPFAYSTTTRYEQAAWVSGTVSIDGEELTVYCPGQRDHSWGNRVWSFPWLWTAGHFPGGRWFHAVRTLVSGPSFQTGYIVAPDRDLETVEHVDVAYTLDAETLPTALDVRIGDLRLNVTPELYAPVLIQSPDGVASRFPRALSRVETAEGDIGRGWVELNLPVGRPGVTDTRAAR